MESNPTIFGKILRGELPATVVYEDDKVLAFEDIHPCAPVHILVIPKRYIENLYAAQEEDAELLGHVMLVAARVARERGLEADGDGFRLVLNNGAGAGQTVFHMHAHVIGGRGLSWPPG
jgi:histidine triad (HIT) family protein